MNDNEDLCKTVQTPKLPFISLIFRGSLVRAQHIQCQYNIESADYAVGLWKVWVRYCPVNDLLKLQTGRAIAKWCVVFSWYKIREIFLKIFHRYHMVSHISAGRTVLQIWPIRWMPRSVKQKEKSIARNLWAQRYQSISVKNWWPVDSCRKYTTHVWPIHFRLWNHEWKWHTLKGLWCIGYCR